MVQIIVYSYQLPVISSFNVRVYETFGISKHFPIKLQLLLTRAKMLNKPLIAKCFIHVVVLSAFCYN